MKHEVEHSRDQETAAVPARLQRRARRLLAAGATFEETLDELLRRGAEHLNLKAVQDFFRSNPEVQRERIERRRQAAEELKQAWVRAKRDRLRIVANRSWKRYVRDHTKQAA